MSKDIHEVQMDVMEWVEIGDLKEMIRHTHEQENERNANTAATEPHARQSRASAPLK